MKASLIAVGTKIDRRHSSSPRCVVLAVSRRTLNNGQDVVSVSYGNGEGATYNADAEVPTLPAMMVMSVERVAASLSPQESRQNVRSCMYPPFCAGVGVNDRAHAEAMARNIHLAAEGEGVRVAVALNDRENLLHLSLASEIPAPYSGFRADDGTPTYVPARLPAARLIAAVPARAL